jgi:FAD/FMN-containing dehydrogenase
MAALRVTTIRGPNIVLEEATVAAFKKSLRGYALSPGDDGYDETRKVWNGNIDRRPGLIVCCIGVADVINAVHFARDNHLLVSVRGGGHNVAGSSVCDGGLMIDLSHMKSIRVDPVQRTARAEPGVRGGELDHETQAFGLATPTGIVSDTGIAGLTLGGGFGWLSRTYGLAADNLLSVDIVTADGRLLRTSATENEELFWGIRGGGGNFGIVTSFEYQLHPVGPTVLAGMVTHPFDQAKEVLRFYRDFSSTIPDALTASAGLLTSPEGHRRVALVVCYNGPLMEGERVIEPLRQFGPPLEDHIGAMPYRQLQTMFDAMVAPGQQYYEKAPLMKAISDEAIDILVANFAHVTSPLSFVLFEQMGGATSRRAKDASAFSHREAQYQLVIMSAWLDAGGSERHIKWVRETADAMERFIMGGGYINVLGREAEEGVDRIRAAFGEHYERLVALKNTYDPTNLLRHNQNIRPTVYG